MAPEADTHAQFHCVNGRHGDNANGHISSPPLDISDVNVTEHGRSVSGSDVLHNIRDLIETQVTNETRLRLETDKNQRMVNEWMIAAAVIDRICFIVFSICFVIGTVVLFLLATVVQY